MGRHKIASPVNDAFADLTGGETAPEEGVFLASQTALENPLATPGTAAFDVRMAFELAMGGTDPDLIRQSYNVSDAKWAELQLDPSLRFMVDTIQKELQEHGLTFKMKAKVMAEAGLDIAWKMLNAAATPAEVKFKLQKYLTDAAGYGTENDAGGGNAFNIQINLG